MLWIEMKADTVGQPWAKASKISAASNRVSADTERRRLAHHVNREMLLLIPADRMRRDFFRGEIPRHIANRNLVLVERKLHLMSAPVHETVALAQFIVGIENSAPSLTPDGQRAVTVLVLV
jgi:hypothetical protein